MFSGCDFRAVAAGNCCRSASPGVARIFFQSLSFVLGGGIDSLWPACCVRREKRGQSLWPENSAPVAPLRLEQKLRTASTHAQGNSRVPPIRFTI